ncbi:hypothetical protein Nepgr_010181 [Nepenthes gracilis]|uniref:Uncharacterized protein n=1 Tax=Nepenthes gracilis TaxID=150966 RepID=A0AAD3XL47_NEPGR|nr:hypothetical protein Nepgr_010181 [Nepenthes gracilis]
MAANSSSGGSSSSSVKDKALTGIGNLIKLLPTGTVFMFQFLSPVLSNNGNCHPGNKVLTAALLAFCGFSCAFATFTDSYTGSDGKFHYGIATMRGLWPTPSDSKDVELSKYKLRFGDFVHAAFAVIVFSALAVLNPNTVNCLFPALVTSEKTLLMVLPPAIGAVSSVVFATFPSTRQGIGYPPTTSDVS